MKFAFILFALLACAPWARASASGPIQIGLLKFQHSQSIDASAAQAVEQFVFSKIATDGRFQVLDRSRLDAIAAERNVQLALDVEAKTQLADAGAEYVVLGEVTQVNIGAQQGSGGVRIYKATVTYGLRILKVDTGEVSYSGQFSSARDIIGTAFAGFTGDITTPAGALDAALRLTDKKVTAFFAGAFPVTGIVASIESRARKGAAETVLVTLGDLDGLPARAKLKAYHTEMISAGGRDLTRKRLIADLQLIRFEGEHLSIMKVSKGGAELAKRVDAGLEVLVEIAK